MCVRVRMCVRISLKLAFMRLLSPVRCCLNARHLPVTWRPVKKSVAGKRGRFYHGLIFYLTVKGNEKKWTCHGLLMTKRTCRIKSGGRNREITTGWFCYQRTRHSLSSNLLGQIDPQLDLALIPTVSTTITFFFLINKSFSRPLKSHPLNQGTGNLQLYIMGFYN